jgi:hypothetical protein
LEPSDAILPRALMIVIWCGGGGYDADGRIESACQFDGLQVGVAHPSAKFRAAFEQ